MSSIILRDLLKHKIRKQILKRNKKINHKAFVKAMEWSEKIPFLMKYHKKKLVFFLVLGIITWNYSLHKTVYYWLLGMRSPHKIILGMIVDLPETQTTVLQMSMHKVRLSEKTKDILIKFYSQADKFLYFGLGRKYLFHVYSQLGLLQTDQEQKMFWQKSQFFKKRNQLASGVGLVQHLSVFEEALKKKQQKNPELTQEVFRQQFIKKFIELAPQIMKWQKQFNAERQKQYLKNAPGLSQAKKQTVSDILKASPQIQIKQLQIKLDSIGLRGLNLSERFLYHRTQQVWFSMKELNIRKRLSHPTMHMNLDQKQKLQIELEQVLRNKQRLCSLKQADLRQYQKMYEKQLL